MAKKATYKDAGVDLEKYADAMARLPKHIERTFTPRVQRLDGGFAGLFRLDFADKLFARNYRDPVLVSCTDGVGTKLKLAQMMGVHNTVGIDLVAMSVNDAICCGAEPLFFLDYVAMGEDDPPLLEQIVEGISNGCVETGCALLGGETAIMPDIYQKGDYDLAGFCVGVAESDQIIDGSAVKPGDVLLGVASNGLHSNGFSLVRKIVFEMAGMKVDDQVDELGSTVGETLLTPTRLYPQPIRDVLSEFPANEAVRAISHITGGGLHENLARVLPKTVRSIIKKNSWEVPPVFGWLQKLGEVEPNEMDRVFNMGLGLVLSVDPSSADSIAAKLNDVGFQTWTIGRVEEGDGTSVWEE
jgi:phosphoribosylformylglycinamidine cyclo-ligase